MHERNKEFLQKLIALLQEYEVELVASDDGASWGMHRPQIDVEFGNPMETYSIKYMDGQSNTNVIED